MKRLDWLDSKHKELSAQILELEKEREVNRSAEHKALLVDLKKQRLLVKEEKYSILYSLEKASEDVSVN